MGIKFDTCEIRRLNRALVKGFIVFEPDQPPTN